MKKQRFYAAGGIFFGAVVIGFIIWVYIGSSVSSKELLPINQFYSCGYYSSLKTDSSLCPSSAKIEEGQSKNLNDEDFKKVASDIDIFDKANLSEFEIVYPIKGSWFPPDITPPLVVWNDLDSKSWLVYVTLKETQKAFLFLTDGRFNQDQFDYRVPVLHETLFSPSKYRAWKFDSDTWSYVTKNSIKEPVEVRIYGLKQTFNDVSTKAITSLIAQTKGSVSFKTAPHAVEAPIFYRDVMLAVVRDQNNDKDVLFTRGKFSGIKWSMRDISKEQSHVVMENQKGCANCHAASRDGKWFGMEFDTDELLGKGDKSGYGLKAVEKNMLFTHDEIIRFRAFIPENVKNYTLATSVTGEQTVAEVTTGGYYPRPSPDGRYVVVTGVDSAEHLYFNLHPDKPCLFTFYLMGGILVYWDRVTKEIKALPGANDMSFVHQDSDWSPDGKTIAFIRAPHKDARSALFSPRSVQDFAQNRDQWKKEVIEEKDANIQFDLYTIPFNDGRGGEAKPIPGASGDGKSHSNPRYSPDGKWIVYTQTATGMLLQPDSELYMIPSTGGAPRRLNANTKFFNSWHSWSPNGHWLVFASKAYSNYTQMLLTYIDENGIDYPPVIIPQTVASNRAVNLPEFLNMKPDAIQSVATFEADFLDDYNRGLSLMEKEKWKEAEAALKESADKSWRFAETFLARGYVALKQGKLDEARRYFEGAIVRDDHFYHAFYSLGLLHLENGDAEQAIENFKIMLKQNPDEPNGWHNLAVAQAMNNKQSEAIASFEKALELNPDRPVTCYNLGILYKDMKNEEKSKELLGRALVLANAKGSYDLSEVIKKAL